MKAQPKSERQRQERDRTKRPHGVYESAHGFPSPAKDHEEGPVDPYAWLMLRPGSTFWMQVEDHYLEEFGLFKGDMVAVDRDRKRRVGDMVLAIYDGEYVLGRLQKFRQCYVLQTDCRKNLSECFSFTPDTEVFGTVVGLFRRCGRH